MRLEQAAAGSWPVHTGVVQDSGRLLRAMVTACKGSHDAVVRVYEALLRWVCGVGGWWVGVCLDDSKQPVAVLSLRSAAVNAASW